MPLPQQPALQACVTLHPHQHVITTPSVCYAAGDILEGLALMDAIAGDGDPFYEVSQNGPCGRLTLIMCIRRRGGASTVFDARLAGDAVAEDRDRFYEVSSNGPGGPGTVLHMPLHSARPWAQMGHQHCMLHGYCHKFCFPCCGPVSAGVCCPDAATVRRADPAHVLAC